jgi:hypothetical protein
MRKLCTLLFLCIAFSVHGYPFWYIGERITDVVYEDTDHDGFIDSVDFVIQFYNMCTPEMKQDMRIFQAYINTSRTHFILCVYSQQFGMIFHPGVLLVGVQYVDPSNMADVTRHWPAIKAGKYRW